MILPPFIVKKVKKTRKPLTTLAIAVVMASPVALTACGGGSETTGKLEKEVKRIGDQISDIADDVKNDYREFEDKLSDDEKSMAKILESVFLPEKTEENLKNFLDKLTPEGGKGGLYVGHFVEINDGDNSDVDVGAVYFDISDDFGGSVDGRISYQQLACQDNKSLAIDSAFKVDEVITGKLSGSLDTPEFLDMKYVRDLKIETPSLLTTFSGKFEGNQWVGSFQYQDGLGGTELSSGIDNCQVSYRISNRSDYATYPMDYQLGSIAVNISGTGSATTLRWTNPSNASLILVSQVNVNKAKAGANGYERNQIFNAPVANSIGQYSPVMSSTPTNYAFVVQAFDANNQLIGYDALVMDLPAQ